MKCKRLFLTTSREEKIIIKANAQLLESLLLRFVLACVISTMNVTFHGMTLIFFLDAIFGLLVIGIQLGNLIGYMAASSGEL